MKIIIIETSSNDMNTLFCFRSGSKIEERSGESKNEKTKPLRRKQKQKIQQRQQQPLKTKEQKALQQRTIRVTYMHTKSLSYLTNHVWFNSLQSRRHQDSIQKHDRSHLILL